jgi:uncharacterized YigZ family protein
MPDYLTVQNSAEVEIVINKSRFIGRCFPVQTEEEALSHLERIRKQHYDATHNCYAYAVGERGEIARFSDDGEPGGTAGLPMMEVLKKRGITYCLVIVTRYFGGILLGAGGLVRAYTKSAAEAVAAAGVLSVRECLSYSLSVPYPLWGKVEGWLRSSGLLYGEPEYAECVNASAAVSPGSEQGFLKQCAELTDGKITPVFLGKVKRSDPVS